MSNLEMQLNKTCHYVNPRYNILRFVPCPIQHRSYHNKTKLQKAFKMSHIHSHTQVTVKHHKAFVESKTFPFPRQWGTPIWYTHCYVASSFVYFRLHVNFISPTICNLWQTWLNDFSFKKNLNKATSIQLWMCHYRSPRKSQGYGMN
jgi:hypothetical protein